MKRYVINVSAALFFAITAPAQQTRPTTGTAETKGTCSPANSGTITTFSFTCTGLTPAQQQLLESVPELLNKLLASQTDNTSEILAKLNTCIVQSAPRTISTEQRKRIVAVLANPPGKPEIQIRATNSTSESSRYAGQLQSAFAATPGWSAPAVFENMVAGMALPIGLTAYVNSDKNVYGIAIQQLFKQPAMNLSVNFVIDPSLPAESIIMVVGQKPIE